MSTDRISERLGTSALNGSVSPTKTGAAAGETGTQDFGVTLRLQVATLKAQSLSTLVSSVSDAGNNTILTTLAALAALVNLPIREAPVRHAQPA